MVCTLRSLLLLALLCALTGCTASARSGGGGYGDDDDSTDDDDVTDDDDAHGDDDAADDDDSGFTGDPCCSTSGDADTWQTCEDPVAVSCVCEVDSWCCGSGWDQICQTEYAGCGAETCAR